MSSSFDIDVVVEATLKVVAVVLVLVVVVVVAIDVVVDVDEVDDVGDIVDGGQKFCSDPRFIRLITFDPGLVCIITVLYLQ